MQMEWLVVSDEEAAKRMDMSASTIVEDGNMVGSFEVMEISSDLQVELFDMFIKKEVTLDITKDTSGNRPISGSITVQGRFSTNESDNLLVDLNPLNANLTRTTVRNLTGYLPADQKVRVVTYSISDKYLERVIEGKTVTRLQPFLKDSLTQSHAAEVPVTGEMKRICLSILNCSLNGALRKMYVEGAVLQLIALKTEYFLTLEGDPRLTSFDDIDVKKIRYARTILLEDLATPPSLSELARLINLSERTLNSGFKRYFGATVFQVLRNERLEAARLALEMENVPIKQIANRVGYQHTNNFINAYSEYFGTSPAKYRKLIENKNYDGTMISGVE